jgi:hypothetical protein
LDFRSKMDFHHPKSIEISRRTDIDMETGIIHCTFFIASSVNVRIFYPS